MIEEREDPKQERERLDRMEDKVFQLMSDCQWHDANEIRRIGGSEGLRRMRDLRKQYPGQKRHEGGGLYSYRLMIPSSDGQMRLV